MNLNHHQKHNFPNLRLTPLSSTMIRNGMVVAHPMEWGTRTATTRTTILQIFIKNNQCISSYLTSNINITNTKCT